MTPRSDYRKPAKPPPETAICCATCGRPIPACEAHLATADGKVLCLFHHRDPAVVTWSTASLVQAAIDNDYWPPRPAARPEAGS